MRISVPGAPGVYYDTDAKSSIASTVLTAAGRKAPKPQGYAVQVLPLLWSIDVDLREVPTDHPLQYLHPEGAHSIEEFTTGRVTGRGISAEFERLWQFAWLIERETERGLDGLVGRESDDPEGTKIEIQTGSDSANGSESDGPAETGDGPAHEDTEFGDEPEIDDERFDDTSAD
ncbi:hypothetical protein [Halovivax limisalsi]|uniref:hypothetical protein n=1 Tax=Halovivax limisalsi TaxID=1453760 RepID=UPI001FFD9DEF|nr:hypothetical protein [Halovivax limisalsi]